MSYYLTFDLPTSTNKLYSRTRRGVRLSDEAKVYKEYAALTAANQWNTHYGGREPLEGNLSVTFVFWGLKLDIDNTLKISLDSMQGVCFVNDKQVIQLHCYIKNRKDILPRMEVEIKQL